jgi:hypothetical protein
MGQDLRRPMPSFGKSGARLMVAERKPIRFGAPCPRLVPARSVHGFTFEPDTLAGCSPQRTRFRKSGRRKPDFTTLFAAPRCLSVRQNQALEGRPQGLAGSSLGRWLAMPALSRRICRACWWRPGS